MRKLNTLTDFDSALLRGWRLVAFAGHYSRLGTLGLGRTNRVLRYHSVGGGFYDDFPPDRLRHDIEYLDTRFEIVDLPEALSTGGAKRIALTFDDGYRDFYRNVVPILREYDVPATVFVIADAVDDPSFDHNDDEYEYMDREELVELADEDLVTIGNHTGSHPRLGELPPERLEPEIAGAKRRLEESLSIDIDRFCYPYGSYSEEAADVVRRTHDIGVAGRGRRDAISPDTDPALVPRVNGANPFWEVQWDLSDSATRVGSACDRFIGSRA
ncbi:polysaccharide deacetylase family protein [Halorarum halophilum]|uniref:Polysaccharide deacetylase family protein n=1 Tax=Halorarum halophilum TaxID=2743090 RepID=A0A7D5K2H5_9EURY|nr:polysaccharide deacetylase family protein [Halobaculum halophilum]QLG28801.1 polysaccharide deacetylase family protein [Halobaculum halophilum]